MRFTQLRHYVEFRIDESFAPLLFANNEGKRVGTSIRKVRVAVTDSRYERIRELQETCKDTRGKPFFYGWRSVREYDASELAAAHLFHLQVSSVFEPAGEECGTKYDEERACARCGAGAPQLTPLFINERKIPTNHDISKTIAGEIVVSRRFVDVVLKNRLTGADFTPIHPKAILPEVESHEWFQLIVSSTSARLTEPTVIGDGPFCADAQSSIRRCPAGDLLGLNVLSEVYIESKSRGDLDIIASSQFVGARRGLLRPQRLILGSQRFLEALQDAGIRGIRKEIAHLVCNE